jgi:hypothetical protein
LKSSPQVNLWRVMGSLLLISSGRCEYTGATARRRGFTSGEWQETTQ